MASGKKSDNRGLVPFDAVTWESRRTTPDLTCLSGQATIGHMPNGPKRPRDANQLAKFIVDVATGESDPTKADDGKDQAAVSLGRRGGLKGGKARAAALSDKRRVEIAKKAARARWSSK